MKKLEYFITNKRIPYNQKLKYLIVIPCVNREERNAINIIDKTIEEFSSTIGSKGRCVPLKELPYLNALHLFLMPRIVP